MFIWYSSGREGHFSYSMWGGLPGKVAVAIWNFGTVSELSGKQEDLFLYFVDRAS